MDLQAFDILAKKKWLDFLSWFVVATFLSVLFMGGLVPIYADEIATKMVQAAVSSPDWTIHTLFPQCGGKFSSEIPISWYPAAKIYQWLYSGVSPLGLRAIALLTAFSWTFLIALWVNGTFPARQVRIRVIAGMFAVIGIGVLPFTMVLARTEQCHLMLLTGFCVFPLISKRLSLLIPRCMSPVLFIAYCLFVSLLFYTHPKALFFFPIVIASAYYGFRPSSKSFFWLSVLFMLFCAYQSVQFAKEQLSCPDAPILSAYLSSQTTNIGMFMESPVAVLSELFANLFSAPNKIIKHLVFQKTYQSGWLPPVDNNTFPYFVPLVNKSIKLLLRITFLLALLVPPIAFVFGKAKYADRQKSFFIAALWISLVGHLAIYRAWNFYGGALVIPLMALLLTLVYAEFSWPFKRKVGGGWLLIVIFSVFLLSAGTLVLSVVPRLINVSPSVGGSLPGQTLSVPIFDFNIHRDKIRSVAQQCDLKGDGSNRLVVDDLTYFAFDDLHEPLHLNYLYEGGFGADIKGETIKEFLFKMESPGVIAQCTYLSPVLKKDSIQDGNLCCVNMKSLKSGNLE